MDLSHMSPRAIRALAHAWNKRCEQSVKPTTLPELCLVERRSRYFGKNAGYPEGDVLAFGDRPMRIRFARLSHYLANLR